MKTGGLVTNSVVATITAHSSVLVVAANDLRASPHWPASARRTGRAVAQATTSSVARAAAPSPIARGNPGTNAPTSSPTTASSGAPISATAVRSAR
jgi:hypothetical protein